MKKYKDYQIVLLALLSLLLNFGGKIVADRFRLPMWLDSFGTFLMAYVLGPFCGAIVGAAGNIIYGFIDPVAYAKELKLDTRGLDVDYKLFVTGDFSDIPSDIGKLVSEQHRMFAKRHLNIDDKDNEFNTNDFEYRRAIRRVFIFFGDPKNNPQDNKYLPLYDELFGVGYNTYIRIQNGEVSSKLINDLRSTITDALYLEMTGTSSKMARDIPLTIKRNDDYFQSVMITTGSFKKTNFSHYCNVRTGNCSKPCSRRVCN